MPDKSKRPKLTLLCPVYNEEAILKKNLRILHDHLKELKLPSGFEILVVNDGSTDGTGDLLDDLVAEIPEIHAVHHRVNLNLGNALRTGYANARGKYTITYDLDLTYGPHHIDDILDTLEKTGADLVFVSPYMKGGKVTAVPRTRRLMSRWANRLMRMAAQKKCHTFTCMVRGYRTEYISQLNLKTTNYEINPEILYKSMILRAHMIEIPGHLDWSGQDQEKEGRKSGMKVIGTFLHSLMALFMFRPYGFFLAVGGILSLIALYIIAWIFVNTIQVYPLIELDAQFFDDRFSAALGEVFRERPHAFLVGGVVLIAAIQFIALGFISLQSKRYFEELFYMNTKLNKKAYVKDKR